VSVVWLETTTWLQLTDTGILHLFQWEQHQRGREIYGLSRDHNNVYEYRGLTSRQSNSGDTNVSLLYSEKTHRHRHHRRGRPAHIRPAFYSCRWPVRRNYIPIRKQQTRSHHTGLQLINQSQSKALADIQRSRYVVIASQPVHRLQIRPNSAQPWIENSNFTNFFHF